MSIKHERRYLNETDICTLSFIPTVTFHLDGKFYQVKMQPQLEDRNEQVKYEEEMAQSVGAWACEKSMLDITAYTIIAGDYWGQLLVVGELGELCKKPKFKIANLGSLARRLTALITIVVVGLGLTYYGFVWWGVIPALYTLFFWFMMYAMQVSFAMTWMPRWKKNDEKTTGGSPAVEKYGVNGLLERVVSPTAG